MDESQDNKPERWELDLMRHLGVYHRQGREAAIALYRQELDQKESEQASGPVLPDNADQASSETSSPTS